MAGIRIKKGDTVEVVTGSRADRGKTGRVIAVLTDSDRVIVEGVNRIKKHTKEGTTGRGTRTGGIVTQEAPVHVSNVMLIDPDSKRRTRVGMREEKVERDGRTKTVRIRVARRSGKDI